MKQQTMLKQKQYVYCLQNKTKFPFLLKIKGMQRSGAEALKTSKPNWEITNITNSQNKNRTYGQPSEQLFPKRWPLSNRNRTKII